MPSGRFAANGAWLAVQVMAHNLARWTARIGLGEQIATTKTLATVLLPGRTAHPLGTPPHPASATALALGNPVQSGSRPLSFADLSPARAPVTRSQAPFTRIVPWTMREAPILLLQRHTFGGFGLRGFFSIWLHPNGRKAVCE